MEELLVFQSFADKEQALRTAATLENHDIFVAFDETFSPLDSNILGQQFSNPFVLKIYGSQFTRANEILMAHTEIRLEEVDPDYMLLHFSNEELVDVMKNKKDWGIYNYKLAEKLLQERNVAIPQAEIATAQQEQLAEEMKPQNYDTYWILFGYVMALFSGYYLYASNGRSYIFTFPVIFAIGAGLRLFLYRKTLSDGKRMYAYHFPVRIHGLLIFILAVVSLVVHMIQLSKS